jgi:hypothetical protein
LHQLYEYNDETHGSFLKPLIESRTFIKSWSSNTAGLSSEEIADLEQARADLTTYEKIYNIFEYATDLNRAMNIIETRICANNPSVPMNMYRISSSSSIEAIFPEIEKCLEAYYNLIDECADYPDWQRKVRMDLGGTVSYLALTIDESSRDTAVEVSEIYRRFDSEKQIYFK